MKKRNVYLILSLALVLITVLVILSEKKVIFSDEDDTELYAFSVADTSTVTKIFMADMAGGKVLLSRSPEGWMVNDSTKAMTITVEELLGILKNIIIKESVPKTAQENINKMIALKSVKVEVYQNAPKFTLFNIPFFVKERNTKTLYIGEAVQTHTANYAVLEGLDEPYIVGMMGFRGFLTPKFSTKYEDWVSKTIFDTKITRIQSFESIDLKNPEESFKISKEGPRHFSIMNKDSENVTHYDTTKVIDMLSECRERNFENMLSNMSDAEKDSVLRFNKFKVLSLTDVEGKETTLHLYKITFLAQEMEDGTLSDEIYTAENKDRCYATIGDNFDQFYLLQYHYFDRQLQPLSYFLKENSTIKE